jgi:hypothetical protein
MISAGALTSPTAGTPGADPPSPEDTLGTGLTQWTYDSWTVPWVRVRGASALLAPSSNVTFMVLACETTNLERDRLARHLSAEQCEHRMAEIRADQDTALIFRLDLRVFDFPGAGGIVALDPTVTFTLEDDRGRRARVLGRERGPVLGYATAQKLKRVYGLPPAVGAWIGAREPEPVRRQLGAQPDPGRTPRSLRPARRAQRPAAGGRADAMAAATPLVRPV